MLVLLGACSPFVAVAEEVISQGKVFTIRGKNPLCATKYRTKHTTLHM